jgi:hypothetical protein
MPFLGSGKPALDPDGLYRAMRQWEDARTDWARGYYASLPAEDEVSIA